MSFTPSAVPAAIAGFLAAASEAVDPEVGVYDGVVRAGQSTDQFLVVTGWSTTEREPKTFGGPNRFSVEEEFLVTGYIRCLEGSEDQTVSRARAFDIFGAVESAVMTDPTLGGAVRVSWLAGHQGTQGPADGARGNGCQIDFELHCEQRLR